MHSFYYQNRVLIYVVMTIFVIIFALIFASNAASSIETSLDVINSENKRQKNNYDNIPFDTIGSDNCGLLFTLSTRANSRWFL